MKTLLQKNHRLVFYGAWIVLGLIQAAFTELMDDEAYYWVYSKFFDWGYFDHPPMTGLLIKMGYAIFPGELGVRLFPLLLNVLSLIIIEKLIGGKNAFLFYAITLSLAVLQVSGFVAVPDIPLIFFTALFFLLYKKFTEHHSLLNTFLLGICVAMLLYSKYHAVLIVFFTLLSNLKLLTRYQTYLAGVIALLLFSPHLWWQYEHNWVSFRYHLFESNVNVYKFRYTTEYILGQLLLAGPIAGFILLPAAWRYKPKNETEKALRFTMIGIYGFFLLSSFRGKVEGNWTSPAIVPLIVLAHQFLYEKADWQKILYRLLPVTMILVLFARIIMIVDVLPVKAVQSRFHAWKKWPQEMRERTKGLPVVFSNSYQRASKYWFYSGQTTFSQNWYLNSRNNYNFWPLEDSLLGKPVYFLDIHRVYRFPDSLKTSIGWIGYRYDPSLTSFVKINIVTDKGSYKIKEGGDLTMNCRFEIPEQYSSFIRTHEIVGDSVRVGVFDRYGWIKEIPVPLYLKEMNEKKQMTITIQPALPTGKYYLRFSVKYGFYNETHNSEKIELIVE
ncbi:MAG: glycosyltransferase family 39 protein [Chitinophagaceae bacterium]|nr:glycosyltransferase family 39 protein [Chitinophagaceae bacterium]